MSETMDTALIQERYRGSGPLFENDPNTEIVFEGIRATGLPLFLDVSDHDAIRRYLVYGLGWEASAVWNTRFIDTRKKAKEKAQDSACPAEE